MICMQNCKVEFCERNAEMRQMINFKAFNFRKRLSAEACLKHSWLNSVLPEKDLSNTKNNLKTNVSSSHANYYLFDSNTRTMSVASNHEEIVPEGNDEEEEWEWDEDSDNLGNENITNAETLFAQNTHQSSASVPQITHQQVTNRVTEMNLEIRKRRSENDDNSTSNLEGKTFKKS